MSAGKPSGARFAHKKVVPLRIGAAMRPASLSTAILMAAVLIHSVPHPRAAADDTELKGQVELMIRGSDMRPMASAAVTVKEGASLPPGGTPTEVTTKTDREGLVRFTWPAGVSSLRVTVPGIGYGRTGVVEILPDRTTRAPLAPLVPFAVLEGTVPADLLGPSTVVELHREYGSLPDPRVPIDERGRFRTEVPAGKWSLVAVRDERRVAYLPGGASLSPGQRASHLALQRMVVNEGPPHIPPVLGELQTVRSVNGTVRDRSGRPIGGARVWAFVFRDNLDFDSVTED